MKRSVGVGLLLLSGCDVARNMRDDFTRLTSSKPAASQPKKSMPPTQSAPTQASQPATSPSRTATAAPPASPAPAPAPIGSLPLAGKSESEIRAAFGAPSAEEERPPGKRWRYRDGQCTLDIQLYPNVETKQFTTLAYDVRNNVDSDEGKRLCMAQFQSRLGNAR
ncbi:MAG: hypothetical protein AB7F22_05565 [Reyranella sp.]|uniref:hypothetical protein n=1 Tax=Reyranella sp. TaxID=1929291 RepID=UPI003D0A1816